MVFLTKNILILVSAVLAALCALMLNPNGGLIGARLGFLMSAMIAISVRTTVDLTPILGRVTEMLGLDYFNLFQYFVVLISIIETAILHSLIRVGYLGVALRIDNVFRVMIPFVFYPVFLVCFVIGATTANAGLGAAIAAGLFLAMVTFAVLRVINKHRTFEAEARRLVHLLASATNDEISADKVSQDLRRDRGLRRDRDGQVNPITYATNNMTLLEEAFALFDLDGSGDIDAKEVQKILTAMYPNIPREMKKEALSPCFKQGKALTLQDFDEIILGWRAFAAEHDPDGKWHPRQADWHLPAPLCKAATIAEGSVAACSRRLGPRCAADCAKHLAEVIIHPRIRRHGKHSGDDGIVTAVEMAEMTGSQAQPRKFPVVLEPREVRSSHDDDGDGMDGGGGGDGSDNIDGAFDSGC